MRNKIIIISFFLFSCIKISAAVTPDAVFSKKYSVQSLAVDSIKKSLLDNNFANDKVILEFINLEKQASDKGDKQLKYLFKISEYKFRLENNLYDKDFENSIIQLINDADENKFPELKADALQIMAKYYWSIKNYASGLENFIYAYAIYSDFTLNDFPHKAEYLGEYGGKYYYFRDFATAKKYFLELYQLIPNESHGKLISQINTLGLCYSNIHEYDSARYYFHIAQDAAINNNNQSWVGIITGNLANIYFQQKNYDEAIPLLEKNIELSMKNHVLMDAALSFSQLGEIYLIKHDYKKALELELQAYDIVKKKAAFNKIELTSRIYPSLGKAYAANGNTVLAYAYLDSGTVARDTLENQHNILYVSGVQHKIDVEKHKAELQKTESEILHQKHFRNSFIVGFAIVLLFSIVFFMQRNRISKEKKRSDELLLNILPLEVADEIKETGTAKAKNYNLVTVMFTDFKDFTNIGEKMSPEQLVSEIHHCFSTFDNIIHKHGIEKIKTIGDAYMCAGGIPLKNNTHPEDIVNAAIEIRDFMENHKKEKIARGETPFEIRIGINTGPVVAGIVGLKKFAYDIWGDTVNLAARMEESGMVGKINISGSTCELVKDKFICTYRGKVQAKNKGEVDMYFVEPKV